WETVDALLGQLNGDEELWITLCSSSPWGTRQPTDFLPPSPARDQRAYAGFVRQVVRHCVDQVGGGRVRYWQCDNEPSNTDLLSVHLYGDLDRIPGYLATARQFMQAHGYLKPVVVGEHAGPQPFEFPDAMAVMQETFAAAFAEVSGSAPSQSTGELAERAGQDTPERRVMTALYDRMDSLPARLQMFMTG